jgi:hypothetical protein
VSAAYPVILIPPSIAQLRWFDATFNQLILSKVSCVNHGSSCAEVHKISICLCQPQLVFATSVRTLHVPPPSLSYKLLGHTQRRLGLPVTKRDSQRRFKMPYHISDNVAGKRKSSRICAALFMPPTVRYHSSAEQNASHDQT